MNGNDSLRKSRNDKKDEFYTQLEDIEAELAHYQSHFKGKVIYCNCDDPYESGFIKYFIMNFNRLGIRKIISTCYAGRVGLGRTPLSSKGIKAEISSVPDIMDTCDEDSWIVELNGVFAMTGNTIETLDGNGDFRSQECVELLEEADMVVSNPPFSLFREYIAQLIEYDKRFIIVGSHNAITYKEVFPLFKAGEVWLGVHSGNMCFRVPDTYEANNPQ